MEDIIKSITEAEETAAQIKNRAAERSAAILQEAQTKAQEMEENARHERANYVRESTEKAEKAAKAAYDAKIEKSKAEAEEFVEKHKSRAEMLAGAACGRILGGNS